MAASSRESRRRRIVEGGSDRLAFITGQIRDLPPPSPPPSAVSITPFSEARPNGEGSRAEPSPALDPSPSDRIDASLRNVEAISDSGPIKSNRVVAGETDLTGSFAKSFLSQISAGPSAEDSTSEPKDRPEPSEISIRSSNPSVSRSSTLAQTQSASWANLSELFTHHQITTAVDATERARLLCSLLIAFFVVLSHLGFPLPGSSLLSFRPVFLLLLTNITVVIGRLLLGHRQAGSLRSTRRENSDQMVGQDLVGQFGDALGIAMMVHKAVNAILMDFMIYAVIVICGLSLTRQLG